MEKKQQPTPEKKKKTNERIIALNRKHPAVKNGIIRTLDPRFPYVAEEALRKKLKIKSSGSKAKPCEMDNPNYEAIQEACWGLIKYNPENKALFVFGD